jgi:GNAT superfamily N-acetyltransferase
MTACAVALADLRQPHDLDATIALFDAYRQFYGQKSDPAAGRDFLRQRAERGESVVLLARDHAGAALGFTLMYPGFSSVALAPVWLLNDLFVAPAARRCGVGRQLLSAAADQARQAGAVRLSLRTQVGNTTAQALYAALQWQRDTAFFSYHLPLV